MWPGDMRWIMAMVLVLATGPVPAEVRVIQSPNGRGGTIADLGNGAGIQSDTHGQGGTGVASPESPAPLSNDPRGNPNQRLVTPFQSPSPPNQLTPAPLLPYHPNRPLMPSTSAPPPITPNPSPGRGQSGR